MPRSVQQGFQGSLRLDPNFALSLLQYFTKILAKNRAKLPEIPYVVGNSEKYYTSAGAVLFSYQIIQSISSND
jgi:hypothetical protein